MTGARIQGAIRGKPRETAVPDKTLPCPPGKAGRRFRVPAPDMLRVPGSTHAATRTGAARVAFVIDAHARRIVGRRVSAPPHAGFGLDALEQAVHGRSPPRGRGRVRHGDRASRYLSVECAERLAEASIEPSAGVGVGDSCDDALVGMTDGRLRAEAIHRHGPWRDIDTVEPATPGWVEWSDAHRPLETTGNIPPARAEASFRPALETQAMAAGARPVSLRQNWRGSGICSSEDSFRFVRASDGSDSSSARKKRGSGQPYNHTMHFWRSEEIASFGNSLTNPPAVADVDQDTEADRNDPAMIVEAQSIRVRTPPCQNWNARACGEIRLQPVSVDADHADLGPCAAKRCIDAMPTPRSTPQGRRGATQVS